MSRYLVLFSSNGQLWISDGTQLGTLALGVSGVQGSMSLQPQDFAPLGSQVFFQGIDALGLYGLWVTNGTLAGTTEVGGEANVGITGTPSNGSFTPTDLTSVGGKLFFDANDANGGSTLWVSDGTALGTTEVGGLNNAGVSNHAADGLEAHNISALSGKAIFEGAATNGAASLWSSDGTAAGTMIILSGITIGSSAVFAGKLYFAGSDPSGGGALWATDGTSGGTVEIGGTRSTGIGGSSSSGLSPSSLAVLNGKLYFAGLNADGLEVLWQSDGTATGTTEIGGLAQTIPGADATTGLSPNQLTVSGGNLYFSGLDADGRRALWTSNGTAAGTHLFGGVVDPQSLTDVNGTLYYTAGTALYKSDGIQVYQNYSNYLGGVASLYATVSPVSGDFNGDDAADLIWQNSNPYQGLSVYISTLDGFQPQSTYTPLPSEAVQGVGDFYGNGRSDLLVRDSGNGDVTILAYDMQELSFQSEAVYSASSDMSVQGVGDIDGDGKSDIVWRNANGTLITWTSTGSGFSTHTFGTVPTSWTIRGVGDFNGDGKSDLLWQNSNGDVVIYTSTGANFVSHDIGYMSPDWHVAGVGDLDGDGKSDVLWRNSDGDVGIWHGSTTGFVGQDIGNVTNDWHVAQIGDFNGDGKSEIAWRNDNGDFLTWTAAGSGFTSKDFGHIGTDWNIVG